MDCIYLALQSKVQVSPAHQISWQFVYKVTLILCMLSNIRDDQNTGPKNISAGLLVHVYLSHTTSVKTFAASNIQISHVSV